MHVAEIPQNGNGLYKIIREVEGQPVNINTVGEPLMLDLVHCHLGYIAPAAVQKLLNDGMVTGLRIVSDGAIDYFCEACIFAKSMWKAVVKEYQSAGAKEFGEEIHSDVWGPVLVETKKGQKYYITFTDDYLHWTHVKFLSVKSEVFGAYKTFKAWCEMQHKT